MDEAVSLPTEFSARIARNTQLYLQNETEICRVVDPWGGSYYVEWLTDQLVRKAWAHIREVESLGGMAKAIETGLPKMRIEEAAARKQAKIDSMSEPIIGLNLYKPEDEKPIDILEVDNTVVRENQLQRLRQLKEQRREEDVRKALDAITQATEKKDRNLLALSIEAARARATLGEISYAIEKVAGRHQALVKSISGIYSSEYSDPEEIEKVRRMVSDFEKAEGRRPRILVAKMGQDGHDRGAKVISTAFADLGFDVDIGPLFQTPAETAAQAVENDVHIIGMSSLAGGHKTLLPMLVEELKQRGREDIIVIAGGVIPPQDYEFLKEHGASLIFGPGTLIPVAAVRILKELNERLGYA
jgi:methylmalonyl-CoA mutase